jgi:penicillin-binding protein 1B
MAEQNVIPEERARRAAAEPLDLWDAERYGAAWYPGYLALVRRQLSRHYRDEDLTREGLRIFTALDPVVQAAAERELAAGLTRLEAARQTEDDLAGAVVVTAAQSGEVLAVVGGRKPGFAGFNRALDARRPIGSLVKPAVYLAALESGHTLADTVEDRAVEVRLPNGDIWKPENFEPESHGTVTLLEALAESLNRATVNLGLHIGIDNVAGLLARLGVEKAIAPYPSLLLGSLELAPIEVAGMYGTLANGGFRTPLRAVRSVVDATGAALDRYPIEVAQAVDPAAVYQVNEGLVQVMERGTGRGAAARLPPGLTVAGKTGTSDDFRDSWFAGFTDEHVMVVWVGYDDDRPTGLTGAAGALPIWTAILREIGSRPLASPVPAALEPRWIQYETGVEVSPRCDGAARLMLPRGVTLEKGPRCGFDLGRLGKDTVKWLKDVIH